MSWPVSGFANDRSKYDFSRYPLENLLIYCSTDLPSANSAMSRGDELTIASCLDVHREPPQTRR